jgi:hypothetical protein
MTASSSEAAPSFGSGDTLDALIHKKVVDRSAYGSKRVRAAGKAKFQSMIGALRGHTNELHPRQWL